MSDILTRILLAKATEVEVAKAQRPLAAIVEEARGQSPPRDFVGALRAKLAVRETAVIAEIKKASPSRGVLRAAYDPAAIAERYQAGGAACLSVLTDRDYFQGAPEHLTAARAACSLPVLRKDFVIDPYQVAEARAIGADAILLIVAALDDAQLAGLEENATSFGLAVLAEVHNAEELRRALSLRTPLIGINNRDLKTFEVRLETTLDLLPQIPPERIAVTESGILGSGDVARLRSAGVQAFLVGEAFMRATDPGAALAALFS